MQISKKHEPDSPMHWPHTIGYAVYAAARKPKWICTPGDLICYYYRDEIYFVDFIPYSTEPRPLYPCEYYEPELVKYAAERNYLIITWGMIMLLAAYGLLFLFVVVPQL